jgi:hypothetical protein
VSYEKKGTAMAKVTNKPVAPKATPKKSVATKKVAAVVAEPEIPILMRPSVAKVKKQRKPMRRMSDMEILFHTNSSSAVLIAFANGLNGGLVATTMLLLIMAFVTEIMAVALRDYTDVNLQMAKYKQMLKLIRKKNNVN